MRVVVSPTPRDAAHEAADAVAALLTRAITERGHASLAVSGGATPQPMFDHLAAQALAWDDIHVFQVDERAVSPTDGARNWLHQLPLVERVPDDHRHPMLVDRPDGDQIYAAEMHAVLGRPPVFDVVHLGIGDDGHTASLFQDDPALSIFDHDVVWTNEHRGHRRMTLTLPTLVRARHQVWLVAGDAKAAAVHTLTQPDGTSPAAMVAAGADATLFADPAAASGVVR